METIKLFDELLKEVEVECATMGGTVRSRQILALLKVMAAELDLLWAAIDEVAGERIDRG